MRMTAFILSFALLLSLASAADFSACFPPPSALGFSVESTSYNGSFGNYTVYVNANPPPSIIKVDGPDANTKALSEELRLLQENKMLESPCNSTSISIFSWNNYACAPDGTWTDDDQDGLCAAAKAEQDVLPAAAKEAAIGSGQDNAEPAVASTRNEQDVIFGIPAKTLGAGENAPAAPSQTGITLEQLLPFFGAFLAIVIVSYLVLQQRQIQVEIDPQEERLLSNETRAGIMSELSQSDKIPTDLSNKLGKSKATVVEHLEALVGAGFVERMATPGRKFVFYCLTQKGKRALLRRAG